MSIQSEPRTQHFSPPRSLLQNPWLLAFAGVLLGAATGTVSSVFAANGVKVGGDVVRSAPAARLLVPTEAATPLQATRAREGVTEIPSERAPSERPDSDPDFDRESRKAQQSAIRAQNEWEISQHAAEPIDARWSRRASYSLSEDLENSAREKKFHVTSVDCRNTSCLAVLEWHSYADALSEFGEVVRTPFAVNCVRGMALPEASDEARALSATLLLDCNDWKKAGSEFLSEQSKQRDPSR